MLNKIKTLNYTFNENNEITEVSIGFNSYQGSDVTGNLIVKLLPEDGSLAELNAIELRILAKEKALVELAKEA